MKLIFKTLFLGPCFSRKGLSFFIHALAIAGLMILFTGSAFAGSTSFSIHLGSFKKQANAVDTAASASSLGHASFIQVFDDANGNVWHRVFVGPYDTREQAGTTLSQLKKMQFSDYYAVMEFSDPLPGSLAKSSGSTAPALKSSAFTFFNPLKNSPSTPSIQASAKTLEQDPFLNKSPLTLSLATGWSFLPRVNDFLIQSSGGANNRWFIQDDETGFIGINANWQLSDPLSIHTSLKTEIFDDIRLYYVELGPKISGELSRHLKGHLWAGGVYGSFDWDNVPGDFDDSFGWQIGSGLTYDYQNFCLGVEASYRKIQFDYTAPAGGGVTANQTEIDFSGILVSGSVGYRF